MDFNNNPEDYPQLPRRSAQSFLQSQPNTGDRFNIQLPQEFTPKSAEEIDRLYKMGLIDATAADKLELGLTNSPYQGTPKTLEEIDQLYNEGKITKEQANQFELDITNNIPPYEQEGDVTGQVGQKTNRPWEMPLINTAGSDLSTELYSLGMQIGRKSGSTGRGLGVASSAGAAILGGARDLLSGLGAQKASDRFSDYYNEQANNINYTPVSQTANDNYLGGIPTFRDGGKKTSNSQPFDANKYSSLSPAEIAKLPVEEKLKLREYYYNSAKSSYRNTDQYNYKLTEEELQQYIKTQLSKDPYYFEATGFPSELYTTKNYDNSKDHKNTGSKGEQSNLKFEYSFPVYPKPEPESIKQYSQASVSNTSQTSVPTVENQQKTTANPVMLDPNTGRALSDTPMYEGQQIPVQYTSTLEQDYNSPEMKAKRLEQEQRIAQNKELIKTMTPEQLAEAKKLHLTPAQYLATQRTTMAEGGRFSTPGPGDPPTKEEIYQATLDYINANPIKTKKGEPLSFDKLQPITGYAAPKVIGEDLLIPGVGTFKKGEYQVAPVPEGYQGLPVYIVNGKPIVADQKFNQEYYKMYKDPKLLGQDELYPIYGQGYPYKEKMEAGGRFSTPITPQYEVGKPVKFMYGGKMVSGKVAKVENGKLYLE